MALSQHTVRSRRSRCTQTPPPASLWYLEALTAEEAHTAGPFLEQLHPHNWYSSLGRATKVVQQQEKGKISAQSPAGKAILGAHPKRERHIGMLPGVHRPGDCSHGGEEAEGHRPGGSKRGYHRRSAGQQTPPASTVAPTRSRGRAWPGLPVRRSPSALACSSPGLPGCGQPQPTGGCKGWECAAQGTRPTSVASPCESLLTSTSGPHPGLYLKPAEPPPSYRASEAASSSVRTGGHSHSLTA